MTDYKASKRIVGTSAERATENIQGYSGYQGITNEAGGGGGASAAATNKNGGAGRANPITGSEVGELSSGVYYLAGGGGGAGEASSQSSGGIGGGGNGGFNTTPSTCGTANTGGGAGGGGNTTNCSAGGSGVVIVSYKTSEITDDSSDGSLESGSSIPSGYAIRKFTSTGSATFSIQSGSGDVQYVIIAGGGSSMDNWGHAGGAGAGGFVTGTQNLTAGDYSITVGAGGTAGGSSQAAQQGGNSVFNGITATGGGYGGNWHSGGTNAGGTGGSGGGGQSGGSNYAGGSGTTSQTNNITNAQTNSIFSETDTGKDYIWSGSAWTEVA